MHIESLAHPLGKSLYINMNWSYMSVKRAKIQDTDNTRCGKDVEQQERSHVLSRNTDRQESPR